MSPALRIVVVGTTGSGKTTMARALSARLGVPHVELDRLHWRPDWIEAPLSEFRDAVAAATAAQAWVADGNYGKVRDLVWQRATHLVWLDRSFPLVLWRVVLRTLRRVASREELFGGNRESLARSLFSRDSIIAWMIRTHGRRRRQIPLLLARPEHAHLALIHVRSADDEARAVALLVDPARRG